MATAVLRSPKKLSVVHQSELSRQHVAFDMKATSVGYANNQFTEKHGYLYEFSSKKKHHHTTPVCPSDD